jgi:ABC-type lipoprotein export system ATPase subunit
MEVGKTKPCRNLLLPYSTKIHRTSIHKYGAQASRQHRHIDCCVCLQKSNLLRSFTYVSNVKIAIKKNIKLEKKPPPGGLEPPTS